MVTPLDYLSAAIVLLWEVVGEESIPILPTMSSIRGKLQLDVNLSIGQAE
jgi:hypothetical protein